ncbi:MAG: aldose epimerase [Firmicutes bacterium HGW-Firmicutes-7]|nr:MAG: aldose epimerase [Firmicutes bacterium HGW-Firmicutes-7]
MTIQIQNQDLTVLVDEKGAELLSIKNQSSDLEYLWQGDNTYWGRTAPVLFPIVGRLKNDHYELEGQIYTMGQHGFARDCLFEVTSQSDSKVSLCLTSNPSIKLMYPYDFRLTITYTLEENTIDITYFVENLNKKETMYFSIGAHPGFNVPLTNDTKFEDYYLTFSPKQIRTQIPLSGPYLDTLNKQQVSTNTNINLNRSLFDIDALIYETVNKNTISIQCDKTDHFISVTFEDFPYVGIWSPPQKDAPFVCIEPWFGIADEVTTSGLLKEKLGIQSLEPSASFTSRYLITLN